MLQVHSQDKCLDRVRVSISYMISYFDVDGTSFCHSLSLYLYNFDKFGNCNGTERYVGTRRNDIFCLVESQDLTGL